MNLKTLLSEINYDKDKIVAIFKKERQKKKILNLWDELNKYKEELSSKKIVVEMKVLIKKY